MSDLTGEGGAAIAVVGMAGRFPGAPDVDRFWRNLRDGTESISQLDDATLRRAGVDPRTLADPHYVRAAATLPGIEEFDADLFGYPPHNAARIDPQHRILLECAWEAVEDAGYPPGAVPGLVGVYAGAGLPSYLIHHLLAGGGTPVDTDDLDLVVGNDKDYLTSRVAYRLGLGGPAVTVQTACSSSLVAVHLAARALLDGDCDVALAGGVAVRLPQRHGYLWRDGSILSVDGRCRPFDAGATGTVFGSGAGVVVLKRLPDAVADGDRVLALVRGSAVTNDGGAKVGYTAPGVDGQARAVATALGLAGVDPATVTAVEAHGTATPLGDPIEVAALTRAFAARTRRTGYCALGSVKSNIGHLDAAAGVAGLIKAILQLRHRQLVPSLHFDKPNPEIDFAATPFFVNTELRDWPATDGPRRIGVSSFGVGGTNAHVVLEEAPAPEARPPAGPGPHLITLSARTPQALELAAGRLADALRAPEPPPLADTAWTLQVGRQSMRYRVALLADSVDAAVEALTAHRRGTGPEAVPEDRRRLVFLFPGEASAYPGMGRDLYDTEPVFRAEVDACVAALPGPLAPHVRELLVGAPTGRPGPEVIRPALFVLEYALVRLLAAWGLTPDTVAGYGAGEITAATVAGTLEPAEALRLAVAQGRLVAQLPPQATMAVDLPEAELAGQLPPAVHLVALDAPERCVVTGPEADVRLLERQLSQLYVRCHRLAAPPAPDPVGVAPLLPGLAAELSDLTPRPPRTWWVSTVSGRPVSADEATEPAHWLRQLGRPVRFADVARQLVEPPGRLLVEVGPGASLASLVGQAADRVPVVATMPAAADRTSGREALMGAVGQLWTAGATPHFEAMHPSGVRRRVALPTYPFQRQRHWIERPAPATAGPATRSDLAGVVADVARAAAETGQVVALRTLLVDLVERLDRLRQATPQTDQTGAGTTRPGRSE
ncbi:Acyl transferase domain-containing protein [Micromonospora nigra]|uniref:Acyl transferase domain-containing protein n=1 Tax=Micromonospora nigra TaxID=145857 RepID=A0A1C6RC53_9ACTN|nr:type I polyketide synthase [Micromonospora nigra]SCL14719.1 Acyl transferase domain-containing protein [Micromonospora nigra]